MTGKIHIGLISFQTGNEGGDEMIIDDFYKDMTQVKKSIVGSQPMPGFWNSPFFVPEPDNWHLTDDAPDELKEEFERYMKHR